MRASVSLLVLKYILAEEQTPMVGGEGSIPFSAWPWGLDIKALGCVIDTVKGTPSSLRSS